MQPCYLVLRYFHLRLYTLKMEVAIYLIVLLYTPLILNMNSHYFLTHILSFGHRNGHELCYLVSASESYCCWCFLVTIKRNRNPQLPWYRFCLEIEPVRQMYVKYYNVKLHDELANGDSPCYLQTGRRWWSEKALVCSNLCSEHVPTPQKNLCTLAVVTQIEYLVSYGWSFSLLFGVALSPRVFD
jgi:hypothetical protein